MLPPALSTPVFVGGRVFLWHATDNHSDYLASRVLPKLELHLRELFLQRVPVDAQEIQRGVVEIVFVAVVVVIVVVAGVDAGVGQPAVVGVVVVAPVVLVEVPVPGRPVARRVDVAVRQRLAEVGGPVGLAEGASVVSFMLGSYTGADRVEASRKALNENMPEVYQAIRVGRWKIIE
mgnify:CR=1 FL=1